MTRILTATIALSAATALTAPALALEADAFADRLVELAGKSGYAVTYGEAQLDGDDVTLTNMTIGLANMPADGETPSVQAGEVTFENVSETDGGGYRAERVGRENVSGSLPPFGPEKKPAEYSIGSWELSNILLPGANESGPLAAFGSNFLIVGDYAMRDAKLTVDGQEFMSLAMAEAETDLEATPMASTGKVDDLKVDLGVPAENSPELKQWIDGTGYQNLTLDVDLDGTWNSETGVMDFPTYRFTLEDMGSLNMAMSIGGLTTQFIEQMMAVNEQMNSGDANAQQAAQMQMMGSMMGLQFGGFELAYRDGGMASKLLDYYAQENGQTKEELVQQTMAVLPMMLGQLQAPELQAQIQDAVMTFLNDPKSITLSLKPDAPVPAPALMGAAASPGALASALNASVSANQAGMME